MEIETSAPTQQTDCFFTKLVGVYMRAFLDRDLKTIEDMTDDRYVGVSVMGQTLDKQKLLELMRTNAKYDALDFLNISIIEEAGFTITVTMLDTKCWFNRVYTCGLIRVTHVWVERPDGWKALSYQVVGAQKGETWRAALESVKKT